MDESCIRNLAKKIANLEQAQLFVNYVTARRSGLHLGMLCKLFDSIFQSACVWDAQGRPRRAQKQPEQPPQPQPQMLPQQEMPEIGAKDAEYASLGQWRDQIADAIRKHPKTAKKSWKRQQDIKMEVYAQFPAPCDIEKINQYLEAI